MKNFFFSTLLILHILTSAKAQTAIQLNVKLSGKECLGDTATRYVQAYYLMGDQYVKATSFDFKGCQFTYKGKIPSGKYALQFSSAGYDAARLNLEINSQKEIQTEAVILQKIIQLKDLNVTINKQYIKTEADRTTVDIKNNEMLSGGNAYEAISRLPGVIPNPSGNIMLNGKSTVIWIDGIPSNLSGQELNGFLNSLPGKGIEKIELITSPGASFDANSGSGGVINIVTTQSGLSFLNGSVNSSYSYNKYHKTNNSLLLSERRKNFSWQALAAVNYNESSMITNLDNVIGLAPVIRNVNSKSVLENDNLSVMFRPGVRYMPNKNSSLRLNYNLSINKATPYTDGLLSGTGANYRSDFNQKIDNHRNELVAGYSLRLDSLNRKVEFTVYGMNFNQKRFAGSIQLLNPTRYNVYNNSLNIDNIYFKNDWAIPFVKSNVTLNMGLKATYSSVTSTGLYTGNTTDPRTLSEPNYQLEVPYRYEDNSQAVYAEMRKSFKTVNIGLGARAERYAFKSEVSGTIVSTSSHYFNVFPNLNLLYKLTPTINVSTNYTRKIGQVSYTELDPNLNGFFDSFSQSSGNPVLEPNFFNNYDVKLSAFGYASVSFNYSFSKSKNLLYYRYDPNVERVIQSYQTFSNANVHGGSMNIPIPFKLFTEGAAFFSKPLNPDKENFLYINGGFLRYGYDLTDQLVSRNKTIWYFGLYSQLILSAGSKLSLYYNYNGKGTYELYTLTKAIQSFDGTLSKSFFKNKFKVDLTAQDIFNSRSTHARLSNTGLNLDYYQKFDSRNFRIAISYNFGRSNSVKNIDINKDEDRIESKTGIAPASTQP